MSITKTQVTRAITFVSVIGAMVLIWIYRDEIPTLVRSIETFGEAHLFLAVLLLIGMKTIGAPLGLPGTPLTLLAGSLFGPILGTVVALIGNTSGAVVAFVAARYTLRSFVQTHVIHKYPALDTMQETLVSHGFSTIITTRLIPLFPFTVLNYFFGITEVPLKTYAAASFVGMIPGTFMFVYLGDSITSLSITNIIIAIVGIVLLTQIGTWHKKHHKKGV